MTDPLTDRRLLDRLAADALPALERTERDGWLLRASRTPDGVPVYKRANSASRVSPDLPTDDEVEAVTAFYRGRGLAPLVQVSDDGLAAALAARGWERLSTVLVMTGPPGEGDASLVAPEPSEAWLQLWWDLDGRVPGSVEVVRRCLAGIAPPAGYAAVVEDGRVVAAGRGVVQQGWLGVFAMAVRPSHQRRGLARQVLGALGAWGRAQGATRAYLQVEADNVPARALYESAGFAPAYDYHYRRPT